MKFYQKRGFALVVLILAIIGSGVYGISKKPAAPPEVSYYNWICDEAGLLDQETRQTIQDYNTAWNKQYYAVVAVAAVDDIRGWSSEDYARELGARWGLGANDMLLLLVKGGDWYVACGDNLADLMTDTQQTRLKTALDKKLFRIRRELSVFAAYYEQLDDLFAVLSEETEEGDPHASRLFDRLTGRAQRPLRSGAGAVLWPFTTCSPPFPQIRSYPGPGSRFRRPVWPFR